MYYAPLKPVTLFNILYMFDEPVSVAERSKACTVFDRLDAGIVSSNPT
jgi:hypothetical protein